jgi:hypothetical protein
VIFLFSAVVEVLVVAVLQLIETVNQTEIATEIEIVFHVGEIVSTLDHDDGLNLLYVIQRGTKIQVNCIVVFKPDIFEVFFLIEASFGSVSVVWAAYLIHIHISYQWQRINSYTDGTRALPVA